MEKPKRLLRRHSMKMVTLAAGTAVFAGWCLSLFMLGHRASRDTEQDPIRLKNPPLDVRESFMGDAVCYAEVHELLKKVLGLLEDQGFWHRMNDSSFYIFALRQNQVWLLEGTKPKGEEIELEVMAQNLSSASTEASKEKQRRFHASKQSGTERRSAMLHGQDVRSDKILRCLHIIDSGLSDLLPDYASSPILANVESPFPLDREPNAYPHLMESRIAANPGRLKPEEFPDLMSIQPLLKGGIVYAVLPEKAYDPVLLAAMLRY